MTWYLICLMCAVSLGLGILLGTIVAERRLLQLCRLCQRRRRDLCAACERGPMWDALAQEDMAQARDDSVDP